MNTFLAFSLSLKKIRHLQRRVKRYEIKNKLVSYDDNENKKIKKSHLHKYMVTVYIFI